jgi:hypothetical protein
MGLHIGIWSTMDLGTFPLVSAFCMVCFLPAWFWNNAARLRAGFLTRSDAATRQAIDPAASPAPVLRPSRATNLFAGASLVYMCLWNLMNVSSFEMPWGTASLGSMLGLRQTWAMFAPGVDRLQSWYVIPGTLRGGQQVDLMADVARNDFRVREEVSWKRPRSIGRAYGSTGWRKYLNALHHARHSDLRRYLGDYLCREWNARHSGTEQLVHLQIAAMEVRTLPKFRSSEPTKEVLGEQDCSSRGIGAVP